MSKDPNTKSPPAGASQASLEDLVYRSSLSEGNAAVKRANPLITVPITIVGYVLFAIGGYYIATQTKAGKEALKKTVGIDLTEQEEAPPPPPPPPPPPAPAAPVLPPRAEVKDAPPPPPINPNQDIVPEIAPRDLPKQDLSMAYASSGQPGGTGGPAVAGAGAGGGMAVVGSSTTRVVDFDYSQMTVKHQPPAPPYPPLAKIAKVQGTVVVEITVGLDGVPVKAVAVDGPQQLRAAAEAYAMQWRFEPAMVNGVPQTARFKLTMPFRLR